MFDIIRQFQELIPVLGSTAYPYALTRDSTLDDEASFIAYPVGNATPTGCPGPKPAYPYSPEDLIKICTVVCVQCVSSVLILPSPPKGNGRLCIPFASPTYYSLLIFIPNTCPDGFTINSGTQEAFSLTTTADQTNSICAATPHNIYARSS